MRLGSGIALALLVIACSRAVASPTASPVRSIPPPKAYVNETAGQAWSWCWVTECADGVMTADAPLVREPLTLRFDVQPTRVGAYVNRTRPEGGFTREPVAVVAGRIKAIPAGQWDYITVTVGYTKGDAAYAWRLR
jgi:hypothetical protein